ncbi:DNA topoisomerase, partial [Vibrio alfacsensis]
MSRIYRATQSTLLTQGWEVLFKGEHQDKPNAQQGDLTTLSKDETGSCDTVDVIEKDTKPPKLFDDASLLKAMTEAAKFVKDAALRKQLE